MCAKKLNYSAGDDLHLFATPQEAMEKTRRQLEEYERAKRQQQYQKQQFQPSSSSSSSQFQQPHMNQYSATQQRSSSVNSMNSGNNMSNANNFSRANLAEVSRQRPPPPLSSTSSNIASPTNSRRSTSNNYNRVSPTRSNFGESEDKDSLIATQLFRNHDFKQRQRLTALELQNLLQNDDNSRFSMSTVDALVDLFGAVRYGTVNCTEFVSLYKKVKVWRKIYVDSDINSSCSLNVTEYHNALQELHYLLPFEVSEKLFETYAEFNVNNNLTSKELKFDKFIESIIWVMKLTKLFRKFDLNQQGLATIPYKDFIDTTLQLSKFLPN